MARDLTSSNTERINILNNKYALDELYTELGFPGVLFDNSYRFTKKQVADLYEIDERTVERYLVNHRDELEENGYEVLSGKRLRDFKEALSDVVRENSDGTDMSVGTIRDTLEEIEGIKTKNYWGN